MLDRIDTINSNRMWTRPEISIETKMGDAFENTSRRPARVDLRRLNPNPEAAPRFSNLLSLLPYLDHGQRVPAEIGARRPEPKFVQEMIEKEDSPALTAEEWLKGDLAQILQINDNPN